MQFCGHQQTLTAKLLAFGPRIPQAGPDALSNQAALQLGHGTQDSENHPARRRFCVERFRQAQKLDSENAVRIKRPQEMADAPGETVKLPDGYRVKAETSSTHNNLQGCWGLPST